jgi:quercetin dioxygenase-like cupin family protein
MEVLNIDEMTDYGPERRVRKRLFMKERIEAELVCYEPGQNTVEHHHVGQDEIFIIMDGAGTIVVDGESRPVTKGDMIFAPADLPHSVVVDQGERMTMVFVKAPGRATKAKKRG